MDLQEILEKFALISGLTLEEVSPFIPILEEAKQEIESKVLEEVDKNAESRRLNAAAAAFGFYKYVLYKVSGSGMESFTAGDISIRQNNSHIINMAKCIWDEARREASDILKDDDFLFEEIRFY